MFIFRVYVPVVAILTFVFLGGLSAYALSSADYQTNDITEVPIGGTSSSADYSVTILPIDDIIVLPDDDDDDDGGGGGGGGFIPVDDDVDAPTITTEIPHHTYRSIYTVEGTRPEGTEIFVNNHTIGVSYPSDDRWAVTRTVRFGDNIFDVHAIFPGGQESPHINTLVFRRVIGDTNANGIVDDFDLALLARQWLTDRWESDFDEDGVVDDFDLAGLASHWGYTITYPRL